MSCKVSTLSFLICHGISRHIYQQAFLLHFAIINTQRLPLVSCRLTESESTVQKRLAWAQQQASDAAAPGLFDFSIQNSSSEAAYDCLQQAMATLSPAVRNKLLGLPADVLDYADLIASSSVEEPVLKPVLLAGERWLNAVAQAS